MKVPDGNVEKLGFGNVGRPRRCGFISSGTGRRVVVRVLPAEEKSAGVDKALPRHEADDFGAGDFYSMRFCRLRYLHEGLVERRGRDVGDIHGDLGDAVFFDVPAYGLASFQHSGDSDPAAVCSRDDFSALTDFTCDFGGDVRRAGVQIEIYRD